LENFKHARFSCFMTACSNGHTEIVKWILDDEKFDPRNPPGTYTSNWALGHACVENKFLVVKLLLNDPRIEVEKYNDPECRVLHNLIQNYHTESLELLIADGRMNLGQLNEFGDFTPLDYAYIFKKLKMIKILLASPCLFTTFNALQTAGYAVNNKESFDLISRYQKDHVAIRIEMRRELNKDGEIMAMSLLMSDGFLVARNKTDGGDQQRQAIRFLSLIKVLPLEMQMLICKRIYLSPGYFYPPKEINTYLKSVLLKFF